MNRFTLRMKLTGRRRAVKTSFRMADALPDCVFIEVSRDLAAAHSQFRAA